MANGASEVTEPLPGQPTPPLEPDETGEPAASGGRGSRRRKTQGEDDDTISFWDVVQGLSDPEWAQHMVYLYRWEPVTDRTKGGTQPKYVRLYNAAFDLETIKREDGSGRYNAKLNRTDPQTRRNKTVKDVVFEILDPEYPPKIPIGEWMDDPRNKKWAWAKEAPPAAASAGGGGGNSIPEVMKAVREMIREMYPQINQPQKDGVTAELVKALPALLEHNRGQQLDPLQLMTTIVSLVKTMVPAAPAAPTGPDPMMTFIMAELGKSKDREATLYLKLFDVMGKKEEAAKGPSLVEQAKSLGEVFSAITSVTEGMGGGSSRLSGWQEVLSNVGTEVAKAVAPALPLMFSQRAAPPAARPPAARPAVAGAPPSAAHIGTPPGTPPGTPGAAPPAAAAAAPEPEQTVDPAADSEETADMTNIFVATLRQYAGPMLKHFNDGQSGVVFAFWIYDGVGAMPINFIKGQGRANILELIQTQIPDLYAQLAGNWEAFGTFVDEFMSWTPSMVREEELEDDETDAPAAPPSNDTAPAAPKPQPKPAAQPAPKAKPVKKEKGATKK